MKRAVKKTTTEKSGSPSTGWDWAIALQLMDTTWRVAIPIVIFAPTGIWLDRHSASKPLFTLLGLFLSLATATLLVYQQIHQAYPDFFKNVFPKKGKGFKQ